MGKSKQRRKEREVRSKGLVENQQSLRWWGCSGNHAQARYLQSSGTFVCITESGWRPDPKLLANNINISLAKTELFDNRGQHINPRICAGKAVRLMWKTNSSVMDALSEAHASAEEATANYQKVQNDFWNVGRTA